MHVLFKLFELFRFLGSDQEIQSGGNSFNAMHKESQVYGRFPGNGIPWHDSMDKIKIRLRHDPAEHEKKTIRGNTLVFSVEGDRASALVDNLGGVRLVVFFAPTLALPLFFSPRGGEGNLEEGKRGVTSGSSEDFHEASAT